MLKILLYRTNLWVLVLLPGFSAAQSSTVAKSIKLPPELKEVSGMTRLPNGDLWLLNDSKNPADLFRFDPFQKKVVEVRHLAARNYDWEDLTHDQAGNLYIGDFGNNYNKRQNLRIFRYHLASGRLDSLPFRYPDQTSFPPAKTSDWNFNCEAMVFFQDSLHLFSKNVFKGDFICKHYVIPITPGKETVAILRDSIKLSGRVVTGAALSKDGKTLALTGYIMGKKLGFFPYTRASVIYFTDFQGSRFLRGKQHRKRLPKCGISRQFESITPWDEQHWLAANEGRKPQMQRIWRLERKKR
ncbi:MAG TPA: hypothetical protein VK168_00840 [Saprospiraceae bacterium]|nr:hypothetical protein [Saprospiraceae bacterium]